MNIAYQHLEQLPDHVRAATHRFLDASCILAITDLRGTITYVNDGFVRISGFPREELVGRNHRILKSGQHPPEFFREMWRTIARGEVWHGEICNRARDGHLYWVESTISPLLDESGRTTHYCALRIDITARKEAQQRLLDSMEQDAERRHLEAVGRMADGILHDLNNLLGGAMLLADLAPLGGEGGDTQRAFLTRMAQLIRNVRDFSTGRALEVREGDAATVLRDACRIASFVARRDREVKIVIEADAAIGRTVRVNEAQVLEVLLNLFTNAAEALRDHPDPQISVTATLHPLQARLDVRVRDNGRGVSHEIRERLFDPFVSTKGSGRGVGLAAARKLARGLGGDLILEPSTGGACFCLSLPVIISSGTQPEAGTGFVDSSGEHGPILVADDDTGFLDVLVRSLRERGYQTVATTALDEAMVKADRFKGCLSGAVLDSIGGINGHALVGFLRAAQPDLPVVLVSGSFANPGTQDTAYGRVHVLPKPFAPDELVALLRPQGDRVTTARVDRATPATS